MDKPRVEPRKKSSTDAEVRLHDIQDLHLPFNIPNEVTWLQRSYLNIFARPVVPKHFSDTTHLVPNGGS